MSCFFLNAMATRAPPVVAKKLVDWQLGLKIVGSVKPDLKKPVQDAITKNSELQRQILEAKESRPKFYWDHYEAILTAPSDQEFLKSSIQGIKDFYPEPLDTKVQATTLASNAASLVSHSMHSRPLSAVDTCFLLLERRS